MGTELSAPTAPAIIAEIAATIIEKTPIIALATPAISGKQPNALDEQFGYTIDAK